MNMSRRERLETRGVCIGLWAVVHSAIIIFYGSVQHPDLTQMQALLASPAWLLATISLWVTPFSVGLTILIIRWIR